MWEFYRRALDDEMLAPFFLDELGDDLADEEWVEHVELLCDFWLAVICGEDTYFGNFIGAHAKMPLINKEELEHWFELFEQTADDIYAPELAKTLKKKVLVLVKQFIGAKMKTELVSSNIFLYK
jgi:hemoglobin